MVILSENRGKNTYLLFTSSTCGICKEIMPQLNLINNLKLDPSFIVISDSIEGLNNDSFNIEQLPVNIHLVSSKDVMKAYGISLVPTLIIVGSNGNILSIEKMLSIENLTDAIKRTELMVS